MARSLATIESELRALSTSDKEALLRVLWEELYCPPNPEVEAVWLREIQRRSTEIDNGTAQTAPAQQVFAELRSKLGG